MSALPLKATELARRNKTSLCAKSGLMRCSKIRALFDHLVGAQYYSSLSKCSQVDRNCHVCLGRGRDHRFDLRVHSSQRVAGRRLQVDGQFMCHGGFLVLRLIFHAQPKPLKVPSNMSPIKFPVRCWKPIVAPNVPSSQTVPCMFCAPPSNVARPVTTFPRMVSVKIAGLH